MKDWKTSKLTELGKIARGKSKHRPRDASHLYGGPFPFIQTGDVKSSNHKIYSHKQTYSNAGLAQSKLWEEGTMLITIAANIAETSILTYPACFPDSIIGFIPNKEICDIEFIEYMMQHFKKQIQKHSIGSVQENINLGTFNKLEFLTPPLPEQKRIAAILSALDDKIELNLQINRTLEEMAMALYKHWFVDLECSELQTVDNLINFNPKLKIKKGEETSYVDMKALPTFSMSVSSLRKRPFTSGSKFQNDDTLLARITPCLENGKTAFVDFLEESEIAFGSTEFITMRAKENISPYYTYCLARDERFRKHAISVMVGSSGRQRVQLDALINFEVPKIGNELMMEFDKKIGPIFKMIRENTKENQTLTKTRDLLLPKLISGEIRV